jgi:hypothetical protein
MRIGGEAPGGSPILYRGNGSHHSTRGFATSDRLGGRSDADVPTSAEPSGCAPTLPPYCRSAVG